MGGKLQFAVFIREEAGLLAKMFRLLVLWVTVVLVVALDEREFDPQVAPPQNTGKKWWERLAGIH